MTRLVGLWLALLFFLSGSALEGKVRFGDFAIAAESGATLRLPASMADELPIYRQGAEPKMTWGGQTRREAPGCLCYDINE